MWTVKLLSKFAQDDGSVRLVVGYSRAGRTIQKEYTFFGDFDLNSVINNEINGLNQLVAKFQSLSVGDVTVTSVAAAAPTARDQFFITLGKLNNLQNLVNLGIIQNTDPTYTAIKSSVQGGFDASYF